MELHFTEMRKTIGGRVKHRRLGAQVRTCWVEMPIRHISGDGEQADGQAHKWGTREEDKLQAEVGGSSVER